MSLPRAPTKCPGSTGEARGLSRTRPPTLLAQVFYLLVAPQARCLQLLRLNLSLCKMSYSPEEDLGEGRSKAAAEPRRQVGALPGPSFGLSTLYLQTKQQLSKCSILGILQPLRIILMAGVLLPPPQCPSRPVLEGLGKQQVPCTPVAGRLPAPGILPRVPLSSSFRT